MMASPTANNNGEWLIDGKTCLVTGANTGIGYYTALDLAGRGARRVILACRNVDLGKQAVESMRQCLPDGSPDNQLAVVELDLASLESVRRCAKQLLEQERELHVLINNAGVHGPNNQRIVTKDLNELTFQTNHLGHFLLVKLLLPLLQKSAPSRIIVVASHAYSFTWPSGLDVEDLNAEQPGKYSGFRAYCQSKLANVLFARQLNKRLNNGDKSATSQVAVFSVHPGFVYTTIARRHQSRLFLTFMEPLQRWFALSPEKGAATSVYCACEPGIEQRYSGCYFSNCKPVDESRLWAIARDDAKAERLWQLSEEMADKVAT